MENEKGVFQVSSRDGVNELKIERLLVDIFRNAEDLDEHMRIIDRFEKENDIRLSVEQRICLLDIGNFYCL